MSLEAAQQRHKTTGRNDPCPCESGKKYKKCHLQEDDSLILAELRRLAEVAEAEVAAKLAAEEADKKDSDEGKGEAKAGKTQKLDASKLGKRGGVSLRGGGRPGKGGNAQSLPRRGAV